MKQLILIRMTDSMNALILYDTALKKCCIISADVSKEHVKRCIKAFNDGRMDNRPCDIDINLNNYRIDVII